MERDFNKLLNNKANGILKIHPLKNKKGNKEEL